MAPGRLNSCCCTRMCSIAFAPNIWKCRGCGLTPEQLQRLCGVERAISQLVLDRLVEMEFLCVRPDGTYARLSDGADLSRAAHGTAVS